MDFSALIYLEIVCSMCNAIFNSSAVHCHQTEYWPQRKFGNDTWTFFVVDWNRLTVNGASLYTRHGVSRPREWVFSPREQVVTFFRTFIRLRQPPFFLYIHMKRHIFRVAQEGFTYLWYFDLATFLTRSKNVLVWHRKNNHSDTGNTVHYWIKTLHQGSIYRITKRGFLCNWLW